MNDRIELEKVILDWSAVFVRLSMRDFMQYTHATGFSLAQVNVLMRLYHHGPCEVSHFVELMQISPAAASQLIERMVQQGLVRRVESAADRRMRIVHLTEAGLGIVNDSIGARQRWMESLMESLSQGQKDSIASALQTLTENALRLEASLEKIEMKRG